MLHPRIEARKLLRELRIFDLPVNMTDLCSSLGIDIFFDTLEGLDGYFIYNSANGKYVIVVRDSAGLGRQRFSIAHELGHIRLNHGLVGFSVTGQVARDARLETCANMFASELLMPKLLLQRFGFLTPARIAEICQVSGETAAIRAKEMGWA
ncbi:MAG: ImmA/IrrE family metallo-endopeptidase [Fretibacterium sp.]|nr:ImmA/IrrE family metallo-endopeptidase [Fretibacterium sp.]